jgi:hypothetical protein
MPGEMFLCWKKDHWKICPFSSDNKGSHVLYILPKEKAAELFSIEYLPFKPEKHIKGNVY